MEFPVADAYEIATRYCRKKFFNAAEAEDVIQAAVFRMWNAWSTYDPQKGKFVTWAMRICHTQTVDHLRKLTTTGVLATQKTEDLQVPLYDYREPPPDERERSELPGRIQRRLDQLLPQQREIVELIYFKGLTIHEVSQTMAMPCGTVKSQLHRALTKLRDAA